MKQHLVRPEHEVLYQELTALVNKHAAKLTGAEMLAVASNMLGKLIVLQDQRTMTPERAMQIVAANIKFGNETILTELLKSKGSA